MTKIVTITAMNAIYLHCFQANCFRLEMECFSIATANENKFNKRVQQREHVCKTGCRKFSKLSCWFTRRMSTKHGRLFCRDSKQRVIFEHEKCIEVCDFWTD